MRLHTRGVCLGMQSACLLLFVLCISVPPAVAQGCVAAHSCTQPMNELSDLYFANSNPSKGSWYHKLTLSLGYRVYSSNKYFIGTKEINSAERGREPPEYL